VGHWAHVVRIKPRDTYQLGETMADDEKLYPQYMPSNISKEDAFRDPANWATIDCEEYNYSLCFLK